MMTYILHINLPTYTTTNTEIVFIILRSIHKPHMNEGLSQSEGVYIEVIHTPLFLKFIDKIILLTHIFVNYIYIVILLTRLRELFQISKRV